MCPENFLLFVGILSEMTGKVVASERRSDDIGKRRIKLLFDYSPFELHGSKQSHTLRAIVLGKINTQF